MGVEVLLGPRIWVTAGVEHGHKSSAKIRNRMKKKIKNGRLLQPSTTVVT